MIVLSGMCIIYIFLSSFIENVPRYAHTFSSFLLVSFVTPIPFLRSDLLVVLHETYCINVYTTFVSGDRHIEERKLRRFCPGKFDNSYHLSKTMHNDLVLHSHKRMIV